MDQHVYHNILVNSVIPTIKELTSQEPTGVVWIFQHDNDPKHKAKKNTKYLERSKKKQKKQKKNVVPFQVLDWPSQSPDLNPIENLWNILKIALRDRADKPTSLDQLFEFIQQEWKKVPKDYLLNLVSSLPRRI